MHAGKWSPIAKKMWFSVHARNFGSHMTVHPSIHLSVNTTEQPMWNKLDIHVVVNWQLSKRGIQWPVSHDCIVGLGIDSPRVGVFLKLCADKLLVFNWTQAQIQIEFFQ